MSAGVPRGLRAGALNLAMVLVIGVASAAPGYSLAAALGLVAQTAGLHAPSILLLAFLPMAALAVAFDQLNRVEADCGTSFAWVARAFGPGWGWIAGWAIIAADIVVMASLAQIAAQYSLGLAGRSPAAHPQLALVIGVVWIAGMTWVCYRGIAFSAQLQTGLLLLEVALLTVLAVRMASAPGPAGLHMEAAWFLPLGLSWRETAESLGVSLFLYWGWDTALAVNAESDHPGQTPGRAALLSTLALLAIFAVTAAAALAWAGPGYLVAHQEDVLAALGHDVLGAPWDRLLPVVVLSSAVAATQTTILPAARTAYSMALRGALPQRFGHVHAIHAIPDHATLWMGAVSALWFLALSQTTGAVVAASLQALNLLVAFYYGLTGLACAWQFRAVRSPRALLLQVVMPLSGAISVLWLMAYLLFWPASGDGHRDWLPAGLAVAILGLGIPLWALQRRTTRR